MLFYDKNCNDTDQFNDLNILIKSTINIKTFNNFNIYIKQPSKHLHKFFPVYFGDYVCKYNIDFDIIMCDKNLKKDVV